MIWLGLHIYPWTNQLAKRFSMLAVVGEVPILAAEGMESASSNYKSDCGRRVIPQGKIGAVVSE